MKVLVQSKDNKNDIVQSELLMEFFKKNPKRDIPHPKIVDWVTTEYLKQTETGKKLFIRLYELAKKENNQSLMKFCAEVLEVFEKNNINGHIVWKR